MFRATACLSVLGLALASCAGSAGASPSTSASSTAAAASEVASLEASEEPPAIVGVWRGEHQCDGMVEALTAAGFDESVAVENVIGNGLLSDVTSHEHVTDMTEICEDATAIEHSHEFTADGQFFSYDQDGEQVDDGTYELVDEGALTIGAPDREGVTFQFTIEGNHLTLEPQLPAGCLKFECQWAVMVAMPWSGMERVE